MANVQKHGLRQEIDRKILSTVQSYRPIVILKALTYIVKAHLHKGGKWFTTHGPTNTARITARISPPPPVLLQSQVKRSGQRSLHTTQPLLLVIICAQYGMNPPRTVCAVEWTRQAVPYCSSFIAKSWLNNLEDIGQGQCDNAWHTISC